MLAIIIKGCQTQSAKKRVPYLVLVVVKISSYTISLSQYLFVLSCNGPLFIVAVQVSASRNMHKANVITMSHKHRGSFYNIVLGTSYPPPVVLIFE